MRSPPKRSNARTLAVAIGLSCGGLIDIFAEPVSRNTFPQLQAIADDIAGHRPTAGAGAAASH